MIEVKELVKELMIMEKEIDKEIEKARKEVVKQQEQINWLRGMLKEIEDNMFCTKAKIDMLEKKDV